MHNDETIQRRLEFGYDEAMSAMSPVEPLLCCARRVLVAAVVLVLGLVAWSKPPEILTVWGVTVGPADRGADAIIRGFEAKHPEYKVRLLSLGGGNPQKLMTAIVGRAAPDVIRQDRFSVHDWASRGAFIPLNDLISRDKADPDAPHAVDYFPGAWAEGVYEGKVFCIPQFTDVRALYWNKSVFRNKADELRKAGLDPERPPRTWSELKAYNRVLTEFNRDGSLKRAGFIPGQGAFGAYGYIMQNNGSYLSDDGMTATFGTAPNLEAIRFIMDEYKFLGGYEKVQAFSRGWGYDKDNPLIDGNIGMVITGEWELSAFSTQNPNAEFGAAPIPVPDDRWNHVGRFATEKKTFATWIGGFGWDVILLVINTIQFSLATLSPLSPTTPRQTKKAIHSGGRCKL